MPGIFLDYCSHWVSGLLHYYLDNNGVSVGCVPRTSVLGAWDAPYDIPLYIYN